MGGSWSIDKLPKDLMWVYTVNNDYELAIRLSKELEHVLQELFHAQGKGLHELVTDADKNYRAKTGRGLPTDLIRNMRKLATIRNKLIHQRDYNLIDDKASFIRSFEKSIEELALLKTELASNSKTETRDCVVL